MVLHEICNKAPTVQILIIANNMIRVLHKYELFHSQLLSDVGTSNVSLPLEETEAQRG